MNLVLLNKYYYFYYLQFIFTLLFYTLLSLLLLLSIKSLKHSSHTRYQFNLSWSLDENNGNLFKLCKLQINLPHLLIKSVFLLLFFILLTFCSDAFFLEMKIKLNNHSIDIDSLVHPVSTWTWVKA